MVDPTTYAPLFEQAATVEHAEAALRIVARGLIAETGDREAAIAALEHLRVSTGDETANGLDVDEAILNVLDALTGWGPTARRV